MMNRQLLFQSLFTDGADASVNRRFSLNINSIQLLLCDLAFNNLHTLHPANVSECLH